MAENYILRVTTGTDYDLATHKIVPVNSATPVTLESEDCTIDLNVRVQNYRGLPHGSSSTSPYFQLPTHAKNKDAYSIAFRFTPKKDISGDDLVFGNDFDHPIRDRLPPLFGMAFSLVKRVIDPGLDGDVYADKPYLYGPAASSINTLSVEAGGKGGMKEGDNGEGLIVEEGGNEKGLEVRKELGVPETESARKSFFLNVENRKNWTWEAGTSYGCDFFNPYLDFNEFALKLPGITLRIMKYWDGQGLRYVLKNRATGKALFVVLFTLYLKEDIDEHGNVKPGVEGGMPFDLMDGNKADRHKKAANGEDVEEKVEESGKENVVQTSGGGGDFDDDGVD